MLEPRSSSMPVADSSIPKVSFGHPYADLEELARRLATGLEDRAEASESASERRRLLVLHAAACQISACLSNTGAKTI
jgi:hypothetical protein